MKTVGSCVGRAIFGAITMTLLLSLFACAEQPIEPQVSRAGDVAINAEDVEQIPIQEVSARERAARDARRCGGPGGARVGCELDEEELITDPIFGSDSDF